MKTIQRILSLVLVLTTGATAFAQDSKVVLHSTNKGNVDGAVTTIDHEDLNGKPFIYPLFTHNFNPDGANTGVYADFPVSLKLDNQKYQLVRDDDVAFKPATSWNVFIPGEDVMAYYHSVNDDNRWLHITYIDHSKLNDNPNAIFFVSKMVNPGGVGNKLNTSKIGVYYSTIEKKWAIFNQAKEAMVNETKFTIVIPKATTKHTITTVQATAKNINGHILPLDLEATNNNPNAKIIITQNWRTGGETGAYNAHEVGVYYNGVKWCIYNEDKADIPENATFNVLVVNEGTTSVKEEQMKIPSLQIAPNPVSVGESFRIGLYNETSEQITVDVVDLAGRVVKQEILSENDKVIVHHISTAGLMPGLYMIRVHNSRAAATRRLVVE